MKKFALSFCLLTPLVFAQWAPQEVVLTGSPDSFSGNTHSWADVDGDGDYDLYGEHNRLWINNVNSTGTFTLNTSMFPGASGGPWSAAFGDFDNDGKPDLHLAMGGAGTNQIFVNRWPDSFQEVAADYGYNDTEFCQPAYWADYDNDGLLDVYITHEIPGQPHEFWQNAYPADMIPRFPQGGGRDEFGLADLNSHAYGLTWGDIDLDGDIDVVTSACGSGSAIPDENPHNKVYENRTVVIGGSPTDAFEDRTLDSGVGSASETQAGSGDYWATLFDYNNDGWPDLLIGDNQNQHRLWRNTGQTEGDFGFELVDPSEHGLTGSGAYGHTAVAGDWDNDGDLDLYLTNQGLYRNEGDGSFTQTNLVPSTTSFRDASFVDYNNDGWLDVFNTNDIYLNPGGTNHWLAVELVGDPSFGTTRSAHGVKIRVTVGGKEYTREHRFMVGTYSQHMLPTHFGLGSATQVDEVRIFWPNGAETVLENVPADQIIVVDQEANCSGNLSLSHDSVLPYCFPIKQDLAVDRSIPEAVQWRVRSGPSLDPSQFSELTTTHTQFTPSGPGIYTLEVSYQGCPDSALTVLLRDTDFNGDGIYSAADLLPPLPHWLTNNDTELYDLDSNGNHNVLDMILHCTTAVPE